MRGIVSAAEWQGKRRHRGWWALVALAASLMLWHGPSFAAQWRLHPTLLLSETYSDNITLAPPGQEESEFVTQINPGVSLQGVGGRIKVDMSYRLQNLLYANDSDRNATHHQLAAKGNAELMKDTFFVDARSSISQQIVDANSRVGIDNLNIGNQSDVATYGLSPYLKLRLASYANADLRYSVDRVEYQDTNATDGETQDYSVRLSSGSRFRRLRWGANYHQNDLSRSSSEDARRESATADLRYHLFSAWSFLARGGYEDNRLSTVTDTHNGSYWSAGLEWVPTRHIAVSATAGENIWDAELMLRPTERTSLHVGYRDRDVGLVRGPSWDAALSHRTRRSTWVASYSEESTTVQTLQLTDQQFFLLVDDGGNAIVDPGSGLPIILTRNVFGLTDEDFIRQRSQLAVTMDTGKSNIVFSAFNERRSYSQSSSVDDVVGGSASWGVRFAPRTQAKLGGGWQRRNPNGTDDHDDLWHGDLALTRTFARSANIALEYSHLVRNAILGQDDYQENRITLRLNKRF